jgi:uncharacterized protein DUF3857/transglutaminase superfamily protein
MDGRRVLVFTVFFLSSVFLIPHCFPASNLPPPQPAFSLSAKELLESASNAPSRKGFDATVLLDERAISVDASGLTTERLHLIYRVDSKEGIQSWSSVGARWQPWHQKQPAIAARVITADGVEHPLDRQTLSDAPAHKESTQVYSDTRVYQGPLPAIAVGAIVEAEITLADTAAAFPGGVLRRYYIARRVPTVQARLLIEAPASSPFKYEVRLLPKTVLEKNLKDGISHLRFEIGAVEPIEVTEPNTPSDVPTWPQIEFSTVSSWQAATSTYRQMAEPQIHLDEVRQLVNETVSGSDSRVDKIRKLTAKLHEMIRYTGIEFGQSSLVPQPPQQVLQRKYGDCKDKAATLVAMLRASGIDAFLALLKAGDGQDISLDFPGNDLFNHAIVFIPGQPDVWIDATDEFSLPGQLPIGDQGKQALVIRDSTVSVISTLVSKPSDNVLVETREFFLSEFGAARVVETSDTTGFIDRSYRAYYSNDRNANKIEKELQDYVKNAYLSESVPKLERGIGTKLTEPFKLRIEVNDAKRGWTSLRDARMAIPLSGLVGRLPEYFRKSDDDLEKERSRRLTESAPRTVDFQLPGAFVTEWRYHVIAPVGFKVRSIPDNRAQEIGPARLTQTYKADSDGTVWATFRFDSVKGRFTPSEGEALRKAVVEFRKSVPVIISFDQTGYALLSAGKTKDSISSFNQLTKLHPTEAIHHVQISDALLEAGLGEAARMEAQEAVRLEPKSALAHKTYGWALEHDLIGRRFTKGCDVAAAIEQYRSAVELDPKDDDTRIDYAILLEHDNDGERYAEKVDLQKAVEQYRELKKRKSGWTALDNNLLFALFYAREYKEVETLASQLDADDTRTSLVIASRAASEGSESALRKSLELTSNEKSRMEALTLAASQLLRLRRYQEAADLLSNVNTGESKLELVQALTKTRPYQTLDTSGTDAAALVRKMLILVVGPETPDPAALRFFVSRRKSASNNTENKNATADSLRSLSIFLRNAAGSDLPRVARGDVFLSNMELRTETDGTEGARVIVSCLGLNKLSFYVSHETDGLQILPLGEVPYMGRVVLSKLRGGNLNSAKTWLDWSRDEFNNPSSQDPLAFLPFTRIWQQGGSADKLLMENAAALLLVESDDIKPLVPGLIAARDHATDDTERSAYSMALGTSYSTLKSGSCSRPNPRNS